MSKIFNKATITILVIVLVVGGLVLWSNLSSGVKTHADKYAGVDLDAGKKELGRQDTYTHYLEKDAYINAATPNETISIDLFKYNAKSTGMKKVTIGDEKEVLQTEENSAVEWTVNVKEAGFYNIYMEYYPVKGRGIDIERTIKINGEIPFVGADALTFSRVYTDAGEIKTDNQGNQIRPTQKEAPCWQATYMEDVSGYQMDPYKFYFKEGKNTVSLVGVNEPLAIRKLAISNREEIPSYAEYEKANADLISKKPSAGTLVKVQGETAKRRSSPSLYASYDRSSGSTEPSSIGKVTLNKTGGNQWRVAGDWIEIDFEAPEDGAYVFGVKARQGYSRGFVATRKFTIDGKSSFAELNQVKFEFSSTWNMIIMQNEEGTPYRIPLTKGKHTLRMEVGLGSFGEFLSQLSDSVYNMNQMYRKVLVITGSEPDRYRDYNLGELMPEVMEQMALESKRLFKVVDDVVAYTGQTSQHLAVAQTLANQLEKFSKNPDDIPLALKNYKENISSLGTSINTLSETAMDIDYICFADEASTIPKVKETGFDKAVHEAQLFANSFISDASNLGNVYEGSDVLDVWIVAGRDQSTILKTMVDDTFTPDTGIYANVKLIDVLTLLPAVVAGTGPDVALTVGQSEPVNYALRHAAVDLTEFDDLNEVLKEYPESSYESFKFNGGLYGLPETQNYNVLFYRTDICSELGIKIPQTWDDVIKTLPVLQKNNMQIAIPSVERKIGNSTNPDLANYYAQLYQRGARLYNKDATKATIDTEQAINAFEFYTKLFTNYKLEKQYDFVNRFRSGEMPIGIADYNNFNTLVVFAPEINGLWEFDMIPGIKDEKTGVINRSVQSWGTCSMMLSPPKNKENAWKFLKWWASSDTQVRFGRELESVMGKSARYATANTVAFDQLSWGSKEAAVLKEQWKWAFSLPEVAGGYYTPRHIVNAIRKVINKNEDPRETLLDYTTIINEEIKNKRIEFGLPVADDSTEDNSNSQQESNYDSTTN